MLYHWFLHRFLSPIMGSLLIKILPPSEEKVPKYHVWTSSISPQHRFHPSGKVFDSCKAFLLLLISPHSDIPSRSTSLGTKHTYISATYKVHLTFCPSLFSDEAIRVYHFHFLSTQSYQTIWTFLAKETIIQKKRKQVILRRLLNCIKHLKNRWLQTPE